MINSNKLMKWEDGSLREEDAISLFVELANTQMLSQLQGMYGREFANYTKAGLIVLNAKTGKFEIALDNEE